MCKSTASCCMENLLSQNGHRYSTNLPKKFNISSLKVKPRISKFQYISELEHFQFIVRELRLTVTPPPHRETERSLIRSEKNMTG